MANQYRSVLASGGATPTGGDALPAEVLAGKTFTNDNGAQTGTMVNNGAVSQTLNAGQSYTIPEGYHNGNGIITASALDLTDSVELYKSSSGQSHTENFTNALQYKLIVGVITGGNITITSDDSNFINIVDVYGQTSGACFVCVPSSNNLSISWSSDASTHATIRGIN